MWKYWDEHKAWYWEEKNDDMIISIHPTKNNTGYNVWVCFGANMVDSTVVKTASEGKRWATKNWLNKN